MANNPKYLPPNDFPDFMIFEDTIFSHISILEIKG
jgi:hypothetical protein